MSKVQLLIAAIVLIAVLGAFFIYYVFRVDVKKNMTVGASIPSSSDTRVLDSSSSRFTDSSGLFSFLHPTTWIPVQSEVMTIAGGEDPITITLPKTSELLTSWLSIARVPFPAQSSPLTSYDSCCSGKRYWYDSTSSEWIARDFSMPENIPKGKEPAEKSVPVSLMENGACTLSRKEGGVSFVQIRVSDEEMPNVSYYYILGDKGTLVQFTSYYDIYDKTALSAPVHWVLRDVIIPSFAFTHEKIVEMKCR
jgi:hypothetical protein